MKQVVWLRAADGIGKWPRFLAAFAEVFQLDLRTAIAASNNRGRFLPRHSRFFGIICLSRKAVQAAEMDAVMPYDDPTLKEFDNYYQARSASQRERAENWAVAIGLQKVDGLVPSKHLIAVAKRHIEGEISGSEATSIIDSYYETKDGHISVSVLCLDPGGCLLSRAVASQVPSAYEGLTSVFGMGTGGSLQPNHRKSAGVL